MVVVSNVVTVCVIVRMVQDGIGSRLAEPTAVMLLTVSLVWFLATVKFHPDHPVVEIRSTPDVETVKAAVVVAWLLIFVKFHPAVGSGLTLDVETGRYG